METKMAPLYATLPLAYSKGNLYEIIGKKRLYIDQKTSQTINSNGTFTDTKHGIKQKQNNLYYIKNSLNLT